MNFKKLIERLDTIENPQQLNEFWGFGKKKPPPQPNQPGAQPNQPGAQPQPGQAGQPAQGQPAPDDKAAKAANAIGLGSTVNAIQRRKQQLADLEEATVDECGMPGLSAEPPRQQDNVTMNVSMNGSGSGGIRDLLNVLKDIQDGPDDDNNSSIDDLEHGINSMKSSSNDDDVLMRKEIHSMSDLLDADTGFGNSVAGDTGPKTSPISSVMQSGNDLHKSKGAYPRANGGDNAMKLKDGATYKLPTHDIKIKLEELYKDIKTPVISEVSKDTLSKYRDKATSDEMSRNMKRWSLEKEPRDLATDNDKRKIKNRQAGIKKVDKRIGAKDDKPYSKQAGDMIQKQYYSQKPGSRTGD